MKNLTKLVVLAGFVFLGGGAAEAANISGTISSPLTITANSRLTGNVACAVVNAPCIIFGASNISLSLNGFTITGRNTSLTSCTLSLGETAIETNGKNNVVIRGPGLITEFNGGGVLVSGNNSSVEGVAMTSICALGIEVAGSYNKVEGNSISRSALDGEDTGILLVAPAGYNTIRHNEVVGAGPFPITASQFGDGIFVGYPGSPSSNNLIEENDISGNPRFGLTFETGSTGNVVRHNQALGNASLDVDDLNAAGANTYDNNLCQTASGGASCQTPDIAGHSNFEPDGD